MNSQIMNSLFYDKTSISSCSWSQICLHTVWACYNASTFMSGYTHWYMSWSDIMKSVGRHMSRLAETAWVRQHTPLSSEAHDATGPFVYQICTSVHSHSCSEQSDRPAHATAQHRLVVAYKWLAAFCKNVHVHDAKIHTCMSAARGATWAMALMIAGSCVKTLPTSCQGQNTLLVNQAQSERSSKIRLDIWMGKSTC